MIAEPEKKLTGEELIAAKAAKRLEVLKQRREKEAGQREGVFGFDTLTAVRLRHFAIRCASHPPTPASPAHTRVVTLPQDEIKKKEERAAKYGVAPTGVTQVRPEPFPRSRPHRKPSDMYDSPSLLHPPAQLSPEYHCTSQEDVERTLREKAEAEAQEAARKKREERFGIVERPAAASMDIDFLERPVDPAVRTCTLAHKLGAEQHSAADSFLIAHQAIVGYIL